MAPRAGRADRKKEREEGAARMAEAEETAKTDHEKPSRLRRASGRRSAREDSFMRAPRSRSCLRQLQARVVRVVVHRRAIDDRAPRHDLDGDRFVRADRRSGEEARRVPLLEIV